MTDIYKAPEAELQESVAVGEYGSLEKALAGEFQIQPIETMKKAWAMLPGLKLNFWLAAIIYGVISAVLSGVFGAMFGGSSTSFNPMEIVSQIITILILGPMAAGLYMIAVKHSVGVKAQVSEIFQYYDKIIPIFVATIVMYILLAIGFILLIIPGIYLAVCFSYVLFLVVEKDMAPIEAIKTSRKVVHYQWFQQAGLLLLSGGVVILGALALLVGLVWAVPLAGLMLALVYRDVFGVEAKTMNG